MSLYQVVRGTLESVINSFSRERMLRRYGATRNLHFGVRPVQPFSFELRRYGATQNILFAARPVPFFPWSIAFSKWDK